jgi:para-nitrobenzyl esterase
MMWMGAVCLVAGSAAVAQAVPQPPTVKIAQGELAGKFIADARQKAFLGLPYAAPPVGELRWKAPQPAAGWKRVRDATKFGNRCEQWHIWNDYVFLDSGPSEDCLFLNVYTPASAKRSAKLPVMLWIHGGGFAVGAGSEPRYTNSGLVDRGVVLVTINYRLNVFGFLASEDLMKEGGGHAGNYGLMDMAAALRWVRANIAAFGGDPANVTVFGESAGSFAVSALSAAPETRGLFAKMIGESGAFFGGALPLIPLQQKAQRDQAWVNALGVKDLAELRRLPPDKIIAAAQAKGTIGFGPVVDGAFLPESVPEIYAAGKEAHVPAIIGWNHDERAGTLSKDMTVEKWKVFAAEHYGKDADAFLAAFPAENDAQAQRSADEYTTEQFIALGAWRWAEADAATGQAPVYRYGFDLVAPPSSMHPDGKYAWHSDELEYVFGTLDVRQGSTWRPEDRKLSEQMMGYWSNFARTGDPNGAGLPTWPRFDSDKAVLQLNDPITSTPDLQRSQYEFLVNHPATPH